MQLRIAQYWDSLTPEAKAWIRGALVAMGTAAFNTIITSPFTTWKGMLAIFASSAWTGFKLYKSQSPFPRTVWTKEERSISTTAGGGN